MLRRLMAARPTRHSEGSPRGAGLPFAIVEFADIFEGMLHLFFLIRLNAASLTANQSDLNVTY